jgi:hypothetical protein
MTRRTLTTMGSATAVAAVVGGCLLLGPTPQAQASGCPTTFTGIIFSSDCIGATSGGNTGYVDFFHHQACATSGGTTTCKSF